MPKRLTYIAGGIILLWLVGNLFTAVLQDYFIFRFQSLPKDYQFNISKTFEEVTIARPDGEIHGLYFPKDSARGVVLFFHGNRGTVERWADVADQFLSRGYAVFMPDYRGYGKSYGTRTEQIFYDDAVASYQWVQKKFDGEIIVYGRSIGSAAASYVAAHSNCNQLILETPLYSIKDLFYTYLPFLPPVFSFKYEFKNHFYLDQYHGKINIIAGGDDGVVPLRSAGKLRNHLKPTDTMVVIEEGSHNNLSDFPDYYKFLDEVLLPQ